MRAVFQATHRSSKAARTAAGSLTADGSPAAANSSLSGTLTPMVTTKAPAYSTRAAAIHNSTARLSRARCVTAAREVSASAPKKLGANHWFRTVALIHCMALMKVRSSTRASPIMTEHA